MSMENWHAYGKEVHAGRIKDGSAMVVEGSHSTTAHGTVTRQPATVLGLALHGRRNVRTVTGDGQPGEGADQSDPGKLRIRVLREGMELITHPAFSSSHDEIEASGTGKHYEYENAAHHTVAPMKGDTSPMVSVDIAVHYVFNINDRSNSADDSTTVTFRPGETDTTVELDRIDPHRAAYVWIALSGARFETATDQALYLGIERDAEHGAAVPDDELPKDLVNIAPAPDGNSAQGAAAMMRAGMEDLLAGSLTMGSELGPVSVPVSRAARIAFFWQRSQP
ncbi:hypothetical protein [Winogradskya humida]|uniref:Uncharacterized protein n=1 Tax=Winogradskya humida TaxID=113566 RepID=A0ABQ3ZWR4_9ACTN|nr:hypothetical protein [Actinoplanes humidus]GIE23023.1 hypothetical protein Ahu01nite_061250 [Actinoplanes humidus]